MLCFEGETLAYGPIPVLSDLHFSLKAGERVVLLGRSGAGKSTLLQAAYRKLAPTLPALALVPQENGLVPQLSVFHNVFMGRLDAHSPVYNLANLVWPFPSERRRMSTVLEAVGLSGLDRKSVETLSGGQKQRTALARAFHRGGPVLLGDEPVSAVDERQAASLVDEIAGRFETVLLALHDVGLARRIATRLVGVGGGRILFDKAGASVTDADLHDLYRG
ncbi:ATP-binding cassette domain-containing protein [Aureimonas psammosilenae]|uniref:ATP-binding cassette domain-containing protein n=1 Tax=Aureimonas psammosilenae TaxID=2495496 RepID=UPI0012607938|nr:ATP-binding cassette domain-containing protein [Aureimonas psammosilenae]